MKVLHKNILSKDIVRLSIKHQELTHVPHKYIKE